MKKNDQTPSFWGRKGITIALFLPLFVLVYVANFDVKIFTGGDNAAYYALANALASGEGYTNIHLVGHPPGNHFPPGYPFLMSLFIRCFGNGLIGLKIFNGIMLFGSIAVSYLIVRKISESKALAIVTASFLIFNTHFLHYGSILMSEVSYTFFFLLSVYILLKTPVDKPFHKNMHFLVLILLTVGLIYIRTVGITLWGGIVCYFLIKRHFTYSILSFTLVLLLLIPWQIRSHQLGGNGYVKSLLSKNPYAKQEGYAGFGDIAVRLGNNTQRYITKEIPNALFPSYTVSYIDQNGLNHGSGVKSWIFGLLLIALIITGLLKGKNRQVHFLIGCVLLFSLFILLLWPDIWYGIRFILPLVPILLFLTFQGFNFWLTKFSFKVFKAEPPKWFPLLFLFGIFTLQPSLKALQKTVEAPYNPSFGRFMELADWSKNLPDKSVVVCRKPNLFYLKSNKMVTNFLYTDDVEEQMTYFQEKGATHVVLDQLGYSQTSKHLAPFLNAYSGKFKSIKQTTKPVFHLFEYRDTLGYFGERENGLRNGNGTFYWEDGSKYIGEWKDHKREGTGIMYTGDGRTIKSDWVADKQNGPGQIILQDSTIIKTNWVMGIPDSTGAQFDKEGNFVRTVRFR
mgnify:CR=1 FL=1